ncbi:MAG TPA: hypothetical protein VGL97_02125 [Bryobacteraceae bacterium]|jgi:hypothetical protein
MAAAPLDLNSPTPLDTTSVVILSIVATAALVAMWGIFWWAARSNERVVNVLLNTAFFRVVTIMGIIAATAVLSLAGRLEGNVTGAILSGVAGYVLGHISSRAKESDTSEEPTKAKPTGSPVI